MYLQRAAEAGQMYRLMFWLACIDHHAPHNATGQIPHVIQRIIDAWTLSLTSPTEARNRWLALHGCVLLGTNPNPQTTDYGLRTTDYPTLPTTHHQARQAIINELRPLPVQPQSDHQASAPDHEDVCLL